MGCGASSGPYSFVVASDAADVIAGIDPSVVASGASEVVGTAAKVAASAAGLLSGTISGLPVIGKLFDAINKAYEKYQAVQDVVVWLRHLSQQAQYIDRAVLKLPGGSEEAGMLEKQIAEVSKTIESKLLLIKTALKPQDVVDSLRDVHFRLCGVIQSVHFSVVVDAAQHQTSYTSSPPQKIAELIEFLSRMTLQLEQKVPKLVENKFDLDMLKTASENELLEMTFSKLEVKRVMGELHGRPLERGSLVESMLSAVIDTRPFDEDEFTVFDAVLLQTGSKVYEKMLPALGDRRRFEKWRSCAIRGCCLACDTIVDDLASHLQANHICRICSASPEGGCHLVFAPGQLCVLHRCSVTDCLKVRVEGYKINPNVSLCSQSSNGWCIRHHCEAKVCHMAVPGFALYCLDHKCGGCTNLAEDSKSYCPLCRCSVAECDHPKMARRLHGLPHMSTSKYCEEHTCCELYQSAALAHKFLCLKKSDDASRICIGCRCSVEGCRKPKICGGALGSGPELCEEHCCLGFGCMGTAVCDNISANNNVGKRCTNVVASGKRYCVQGICQSPDCNNERWCEGLHINHIFPFKQGCSEIVRQTFHRQLSAFCFEHKCKQRLDNKMYKDADGYYVKMHCVNEGVPGCIYGHGHNFATDGTTLCRKWKDGKPFDDEVMRSSWHLTA